MVARRAACSCGRFTLECRGEPVRVSVCHCLACQRRTGSAFGVQARFPREQVGAAEGPGRSYVRVADSGNEVRFHFCGECGATLYWEPSALPGFVAVAVGAFADPTFHAPGVSIYETRRHPWVAISGPVEHLD